MGKKRIPYTPIDNDNYLSIRQFLDPERLHAVMDAVMMYSITGEEPTGFDRDQSFAFLIFKTSIDGRQEGMRLSAEERSEINRKNGEKGLQTRWGHGHKDGEDGENGEFAKDGENSEFAKDGENSEFAKDGENGENGKNGEMAKMAVINKEKKKESNEESNEEINNTFPDGKDIDIYSGIASNSSSNPKSDDAVAESRKSKLDDVKIADSIIDLYNRRIAETGCRLRSCVAKSEKRRGMVLARLREHGEEKVRAVIEKAVASKFLNYSARAAPMDIEWIFGRDNFPKVLEGKYDNEKSNKQSNGSAGNNNDDEWRDRSEMDIRLGRRMGKGGYVTTI